ncbi:uncharacterized protein LOC107795101 isoform X1 [Nicotiana tabacum]|uniref:Uncharacterized protein LOC107795101 isoform X1 n=2 Tax=Nicotiana TaxID=4085 RepID=A0A1S4A953_TOBAC|nr:PREDICTED: uncharacterized protein LOC107795101 isoform X1 [Nicotiana tabacum]
MNLLKLHHQHNNYYPSKFSSISGNSSTKSYFSAPHFLFFTPHKPKFLPLTLHYDKFKLKNVRASAVKIQSLSDKEEENLKNSEEYEYLAADGVVYKKTLRLVEGAMFAAVSGLAYLLSNSLAIENYFGCFFALPIVISSMRWGVAAGRKTMVATVVLLFVLSGPVKALNYMLMHGLLGFTMGSLWRLRTNWGASIFLCSIARAIGALGYVILSSFLIGENILALITVNIHASLSYILTSLGSQIVPSMNFIYTLFGTLLLINCTFFVFLLHLLYAIFLTKFGMKATLRLPRWLAAAI